MCGDNIADPAPRAHEDGGRFSPNVLIVDEYTSGQAMDVTVSQLNNLHPPRPRCLVDTWSQVNLQLYITRDPFSKYTCFRELVNLYFPLNSLQY